jgi:hypothetical protein
MLSPRYYREPEDGRDDTPAENRGPGRKVSLRSDIKEGLDARVLTKRGLGDEIAIGGYPVPSRRYLDRDDLLLKRVHPGPSR